jgi:hypothetical protein
LRIPDVTNVADRVTVHAEIVLAVATIVLLLVAL